MANKVFSEWVQQLRFKNRESGERPRTMQWVADQLSISLPYLYLLMKGAHQPSLGVAERIAEVFGKSKRTVAEAFPETKT